jgi:hypothetical protein
MYHELRSCRRWGTCGILCRRGRTAPLLSFGPRARSAGRSKKYHSGLLGKSKHSERKDLEIIWPMWWLMRPIIWPIFASMKKDFSWLVCCFLFVSKAFQNLMAKWVEPCMTELGLPLKSWWGLGVVVAYQLKASRVADNPFSEYIFGLAGRRLSSFLEDPIHGPGIMLFWPCHSWTSRLK